MPAVDVQLARAVEVLKTWQYFEDLRDLRGKAESVARAPAPSGAPESSSPSTPPSADGAAAPN